jgi:hypothetical protein
LQGGRFPLPNLHQRRAQMPCRLAALPQCWIVQPVPMSSGDGMVASIIHFEPEETQMIKTIVIGAGVMGASVAYRTI